MQEVSELSSGMPSLHARVRARRRQSPHCPTGRHALAVLLEQLEAEPLHGLAPVVVFDLDCTLFHPSRRHVRILCDFIEDHAPGDEGLQSVVARLQREGCGWSLTEEVRSAGIDHPSLLLRLEAYWEERFFSSPYVLHDVPVEGAPELVRACHARGAHCYYLTGRDQATMLEGTLESLARHGFPLGLRATVHLKPSMELRDLEFKRQTLETLPLLGPVRALFENEPANANLFCRRFPDALTFFLETLHSPNAPMPAPSLYRIANFCWGEPGDG